MRSEPNLSTFDPEFDAPPRQEARPPSSWHSNEKRLLVNPFLVLIDWLAAYALIRAAVMRVNFPLFAAGTILLILGFFLLQYHCLDCGRVGWAIWQSRHICRVDPSRHPSRRWRRLSVPRTAVQIVIWCYLLAAVVILCLVRATG
jgi:hypothetical protein